VFDVFIWDMGGHDSNVSQLQARLPHAKVLRYIGIHLDMLRRSSARSSTEYFWILSSCCDYDEFDFGWMPPVGQETQIHCWATGAEKFGDTFLVHLASWSQQKDVERLEWYHHVNYHDDGVQPLAWPSVELQGSDLAAAVRSSTSQSLYTTYITDSNASPCVGFNKWWPNKPIVAFNKTGHVSLCPRDAKAVIKTQIYDWPYIQYQDDPNMMQKPQDVVFISYDEVNAGRNWSMLQAKCPRAKHVRGVDGLLPALKAAASLSNTPYFYAVFGKTAISEDFYFDYQPDYLRRPSNYIFLAYNPILDYAYGHGGIVMHDRDWLLGTEDLDIDITMSHDTVTIPVVSCVNISSDPWSAWRTAFRESYKLSVLLSRRYSIEDEYHLHLWATSDNTAIGRYSKLGATAAIEAFKVGDHVKVNDWIWLREKFDASALIQA